MGRNGQPIDILTAAGRKHLTKEEIRTRKESEIKLGKSALDKLKPPAFIKNDVVAYGHWRGLIREYKDAAANGVELLTSSDAGALVLYCKTYAEYERLLKAYQTIDNIAFDGEALDDYIGSSEDFNYKVKQQLRGMIAVDGLLRIETGINKKMDMLLKLQDRLFLNPLAKVKNVPKPKKDEKPPSKFGKFGAAQNA